ncbi:unnamed protein product, partial [Coregonus sp. 'balchen']
MPSAMNGNRTVQSASPDVGSAPGQITLGGGQSSGAQTEAMKQVLGVVDKKVRNMEKKKEVTNNLEFARELQKSFLSLGQDREESEQKRLKTILEVQFLLDRLGEDRVRQELRQGAAGGGTPSLLTDTELTALDELYKLVGPEPHQNTRFTDQYEEASQHLMDLLEGKDKAVAGTTYKALKDSLDRVLLSGYFDQAQSHQNGVCEEEEPAVVKETEEQAVDPEGEIVDDYIEPVEVEATEFIPDTTYSSCDKEQGDEWTSETEEGSAILQQPVQSAPPPIVTEAQPLNGAAPTGTPPANSVVRKQVVQDLLSQMQGPYNFMQDSMLEFDGQPIDPAIVSAQHIDPAIVSAQHIDPAIVSAQHIDPAIVSAQHIDPAIVSAQHIDPAIVSAQHIDPAIMSAQHIDPAIVSAQPMKAPAQNMDLPQMGCPPVSPSSEQPPASSETQQVFQPVNVSKPPHSSGINVNAAPFQSMQTVFNLNPPVPPANETEALTQASQYQNSYSQQGFSSQSQQLPDPSLPSQDLPQGQQPGQQGSGFGPGAGRQAQPFYNSRGMTRGGPRGYDSYRPPFANTPNSGYQQAQFNTPRDYSNGGNYQRGDGYNQNYKRGA